MIRFPLWKRQTNLISCLAVWNLFFWNMNPHHTHLSSTCTHTHPPTLVLCPFEPFSFLALYCWPGNEWIEHSVRVSAGRPEQFELFLGGWRCTCIRMCLVRLVFFLPGQLPSTATQQIKGNTNCKSGCLTTITTIRWWWWWWWRR